MYKETASPKPVVIYRNLEETIYLGSGVILTAVCHPNPDFEGERIATSAVLRLFNGGQFETKTYRYIPEVK
jgi:hypothetical protein